MKTEQIISILFQREKITAPETKAILADLRNLDSVSENRSYILLMKKLSSGHKIRTAKTHPLTVAADSPFKVRGFLEISRAHKCERVAARTEKSQKDHESARWFRHTFTESMSHRSKKPTTSPHMEIGPPKLWDFRLPPDFLRPGPILDMTNKGSLLILLSPCVPSYPGAPDLYDNFSYPVGRYQI